MITLFRWWMYKSKSIRWKLAFYQFLEQQLKNPEELEKKLVEAFSELIHKANLENKTEAEEL